MRVLFCTLAQTTHFLVAAPLIEALRSAGHDVQVACQPGFVDTVTAAGLTAVTAGNDLEMTYELPEEREEGRRGLPPPYDLAELEPAAEWSLDRAEEFEAMVEYAYGEENRPLLAGLVDYARRWQPDLVLWEPFTYSGPIAAAACGAPHGRVLFSTDILGVTHQWFHRHAPEHGDALAQWLRGLGERYGLSYDDSWRLGQFTVDQTPDSLRIAADTDYLPMRYTPYGGRASVPEWLTKPPQAPRVALTMGLSATEYFNGYTFRPSDIFAATEDLDIELVATVAASEQSKVGPVPANVRLVSFAPLHALAPTCTAAIHHGGFGTLSTFALHGVPQLVLPYHFEGPLLAGRLARHGAGLSLHSDQVSGEAVRERLLRLLREPTFRVRAGDLREEVDAMPTPNEVAAALTARSA